MYGLVQALEDAQLVFLQFEDKNQAQNFIDFVHLYIQESGAGNGYGAYWHYSGEPIIGIDCPMPSAQAFLKRDLIEEMTNSIWFRRLAQPPTWQSGNRSNEYQAALPQFGVRNKGITFSFDKNLLPPRLQPGMGDLAVIVDSPDFDGVIGRVRKVEHGVATLGKCDYSSLETDVDLPVANVMKIHDFLSRI